MKKYLLPLLLVLSACAHQSSSNPADFGGEKILLPPATPHEVESFRVSDPEPPEVADQELESIPSDYNEKVEQWLKYFQGKGRPHMERYLSRSTRYLKLMKKILRENGLPEDLIYIALIESGFSHKATSHASAVGYWQFIRGTGKRYGLEISGFVDERRDPVLSTQAAAEYFKGLYSVFGSWYLAMASYNVGENRVKKEVMNHYTRDFWELARKKRFPKETVNYIPKFIAAKMIGHDPKKYGFTDIDYEKPLEFELIKVNQPVNLRQMATKLNYDYDDLKQFNPKFKGEIAITKKNGSDESLELRVPIGMSAVALIAAQQSPVQKMEFIADAGETIMHKVRAGESLYTIAKKYRTNVASLRDLNDLKPGRKLRIGMRIQVPERGSKKVVSKAIAKNSAPVVAKPHEDDVQKATETTEVTTAEGRFYVVQPGDNLSQIADEYDATITELRKLNKLRRGSVLRVGMRLRVPSEDAGIPVAPDSDRVVPSRGPQSVVPFAHTVKPGETFTSIAKRYGVSVEDLKKANKMKKKSNLKVGSRIQIPVSASSRYLQNRKFHVVRRGENLNHIAGKYKVSLKLLSEKNKLNTKSKLFVGVRLMIPEAQAAR